MQSMHAPAGETIFRTGDPSSAVYVIEDGEVAITVSGGTEVARLHPGELFGEFRRAGGPPPRRDGDRDHRRRRCWSPKPRRSSGPSAWTTTEPWHW